MNDSSHRSPVTGATGPITRSEWAVALLGLLLVTGTIGYLVYLAAFVPERPADVVVNVGRVAASTDGHRVDVTVKNQGGTTAAEVTVEGTVSRDGAVVETSEVTFDFVPPGSERSATLKFRENPGTLPLDLRVVGFREP